MRNKTLVVVGGPTAVGKTEIAVRLAKALDTDVLSADSRQCYRELKIGTARPTQEEMQGVTHHFIASHSIQEKVSAGDYARYARRVMERVFEENDWLVMTGGTGLYIRAALEGMDELPDAPESLRQTLNQWPLRRLQEELRRLDPEYASRADLNNPQRLVRALEVSISSGKPYSAFLNRRQDPLPYRVIRIALTMDRAALYARIGKRADQMVENGLFEEALSLREFQDHYALRTVGYKEIFAFEEGACTREQAIELIKQNTRRYAKRQLTWFRKDDRYAWFEPFNGREIVHFVHEKSH